MIPYHYPVEWRTIAREIKETCGYRCQQCDRQCRRPGEFWLGWDYELTVAHISQDYEAEAVTVAALCVRCHLIYDAPHSWLARQRWARQRRRNAGQLEISLR